MVSHYNSIRPRTPSSRVDCAIYALIFNFGNTIALFLYPHYIYVSSKLLCRYRRAKSTDTYHGTSNNSHINNVLHIPRLLESQHYKISGIHAIPMQTCLASSRATTRFVNREGEAKVRCVNCVRQCGIVIVYYT